MIHATAPLAPFGSGLDAVAHEDALDGLVGNAFTDVPERAFDTPVAPARILLRHADGELIDDLHDARASGTCLVGPLLRAGPSVPTEERARCHDGGEVAEKSSTDGLRLRCEPTLLEIGQPDAPI